VMANGRIVHSGPAEGLADAVALREAFMGRVAREAHEHAVVPHA